MVSFKIKSIQARLTITNFIVMSLFTTAVFYLIHQGNIQRLKKDLTSEVETYLSFINQDLIKIAYFDSIDMATDLTSRLRSFKKINSLVVINDKNESVFIYRKEDYTDLAIEKAGHPPFSVFHEKYFSALMPLIYNGGNYGEIQINVSTLNIDAATQDYEQQLYSFIFILVSASFFLSLLFNYLVSSPISKLIDNIKHIGKTGDFTSLITVKRKDEIGELFSGFNDMQRALSNAYKELNIQKIALDEHAIVSMADVDGAITFVNKRLEDISGYSKDELLGKNHRLFNSGLHPKEFFVDMYKVITCGEVWHGEMCNKDKQGVLFWLETTIVPIKKESGKPEGYIAIRTDITELKAIQEKAVYLAQHDVLTGLPNRLQADFYLKNALDRIQRNGLTLAVIFMDLNKFKVINDTLGHDAGDTVLIEISKRFKDGLRKVDFVGRHGGDEFVAIIEDVKDHLTLSRLLAKIMTMVGDPITINGKPTNVGVSMGVSLCPGDAETIDDLFVHADVAMYNAKKKGGSNYQFYTEDLNKKVVTRYRMESEIKEGLVNNEFFCVYQPKVNMLTKKIIGAEVLLRWKNGDGKFISPAEFIPVVEECGLIDEMWGLILDSSLSFVNKLHNKNKKIPLALNVSPLQFNDEFLGEKIIERLKYFSLPMNAISIEITEGLLIEDNANALKTLELISSQGISIAIDDFGTGYSSLKYLKDYPIDLVKLDISFISGIGLNKKDEQLVKTMIEMSIGLGKEVIAEGVETQKQSQFLIENGCQLAQGYLYSKPLTDNEFMAFIDDDSKVLPLSLKKLG